MLHQAKRLVGSLPAETPKPGPLETLNEKDLAAIATAIEQGIRAAARSDERDWAFAWALYLGLFILFTAVAIGCGVNSGALDAIPFCIYAVFFGWLAGRR
jgi:hypothetical protein